MSSPIDRRCNAYPIIDIDDVRPESRSPGDSLAIRARDRGIDGPGSAGGDFHARCDAAGRTRVIIGDVRGKGAAAARKAGLLAAAFPAVAEAAADLEQVSGALDRLVALDAASEADPAGCEWFATALLLEIDEPARRVTVVNHGHPAPVLVGPGLVRELAPSCARLPLGLGELAPARGSADSVELPGDATLILFTDGVSEARDRTGRMFDPVAWLVAANQQAPDAPAAGAGDPASLLERLYLAVARHNGGAWHDDLALVSVRRHTGADGVLAAPAPPLPAQHRPAPGPPRPGGGADPPISRPAPEPTPASSGQVSTRAAVV